MTTISLPKKLLMKPGQRALILNAPAGYLDALAPLPEGVEIVTSPGGEFDFVQLFVKDMAELKNCLPLATQAVNRDRLRAAVSEHNFEGVTLISLDDVWSAMRFRPSERVGK